jgi:transposase
MRNWAHPIEIRERAVAAVDSGQLTVAEAAALFQVGERTLYEWKRIRRERGSLTPLAHQSGNKPRVDEKGAEVVRQILADDPDATIEQTAVHFVRQMSKPCSPSSMGRALARIGLTRKKRR